MPSPLLLRDAVKDDFDRLGDVMFDAIRNGPTHYSKAQSEAWAPERREGPAWAERLSGKQIILAEQEDQILGFMTIEDGGYIDLAFIRPAAQGTGLFRKLFERIEDVARQAGKKTLTTHASLMAQPAFAGMGFKIDQREIVRVADQKLKRAQMSKRL